MKSSKIDLSGTPVLVSCEGGAEQTVIEILLDAGALCFSRENVIDITGIRTANGIETEYLAVDYGRSIALLRIVDSRNSNFKLRKLYRQKCCIYRICTCPEIEMLVILNEGKQKEYSKVMNSMKPSDFCKMELAYPYIKKPEWLRQYWTADTLVNSIARYKQIHQFRKNELCLWHILSSS